MSDDFIADALLQVWSGVPAVSTVDLDRSIDVLGLSTGLQNALQRERILTIRDVTNLTGLELSELRCVGKVRLQSLREALAEHNIRLRGD